MKKVLIITYYWPPGGGAGIYRVLKTVKYLPHFDWQPVILTVQHGNYPVIDLDLEKDIPPGNNCTVYKSKSIEPFNLYRKFTGRKSNEKIPDYVFDEKNNLKDRISRWIRVNLFIPDSRMGWIPAAVKAGMKIIKDDRIDLIFTSSPPHTVQVIARRLAGKSGIKWIADFRDPWTEILTYENIKRNFLAAFIDRHLEKSVLRRANAITCVTQQYIDTFRQRVNNLYFNIPNGFDEDDFINVDKVPSGKFRITYTGNLSESRNISNVLLALKNLEPAIIQNIEFSFYGFVNQKVKNLTAELQLNSIVRFHPSVPHQVAIGRMVNSEILLLVVHQTAGNKGIIPGKLYEYARTYNYILTLGPKEGEVAQFLQHTRSGQIFDYHEDLTGIIRQRYDAWLSQESFQPDQEKIKKFSRKNLCAELVSIFDKVLQAT
jgi:glycosyltransferase involved in cell wall biosynthesis